MKVTPISNARLDLEWARKHIPAFAKMEREAKQTKESEEEYRKLMGEKK